MLFRLPSILAVLGSGLCVFAFLRRYLDTAAAAYGMVFSLLGALAWHGIQARPYALVTACFAGAILLWDGIDSQQHKLWRVCTMSVLLASAISLHFYATLFVSCIGIIELLWSALNRRIRISVWLGLFLAGASSLAWLPLIRVHSHFIANETASTSFYARPTLGSLIQAYSELMIFDRNQILFLTATVCIIGTILTLGRMRVASLRSITTTALPNRSCSNLYLMAICALAFPLLVFAFASVVTKTFNVRYSLIATLGFSCLIAYVFSSLPAFRWAASAILLTACPLALLSSPYHNIPILDQVAVVKQAAEPYPIVIGEGLAYFELEEAVPKEMKSRLVYVDAPPGVVSPDPTNEHHVDRWHLIRPDLKVVSAKDFFAQNPRFYLYHTRISTDVITTWLMQQHLIGRPIAEQGDAWLFEAEAPKSMVQ
jgi:hypothetical protein